MRVLGITLGHDTSFALVENGEILGILEAERYFRQMRYKLACPTLKPGKVPSGYQYVDVEELRQFLGCPDVDAEGLAEGPEEGRTFTRNPAMMALPHPAPTPTPKARSTIAAITTRLGMRLPVRIGPPRRSKCMALR